MRKAAEAKAALDALGKSGVDAANAQLVAENKLVDAHKSEVAALKEEAAAARVTADAYKAYNIQALYGGRSDMQSHLGDMERELQYETLLNRQRWLGFTTPQQAYAWRQNEYQQRLLMNRAEWAGYSTADQYLAYLQKQTTAWKELNAAMRERAALYKQNADAALAYYNAVSGAHKTLGELTGGDNLVGIQAINDALTGLPDNVSTQVTLTGIAQAMAALAAYKAELASVPQVVSTVTADKIMAAGVVPGTAPGGGGDVIAAGGAAGGGGGSPPPVVPMPGGAPEEPNPNDINAMAAAVKNAAAAKQDLAAADLKVAQADAIQAAGDNSAAMALIQEHLAGQQAGSTAASTAQDFLALAAAQNNAEDAAKYGYLAQVALNAAGKDTERTVAAAAGATRTLGVAFREAGTRGLGLKVVMAGGLLPSIGILHIAFDAILEALAILIPALATMVLGLTAWGAAGAQSAQQVYERMKAVHTVVTATGQAVYPLTQNFQALQDAVRPQVWQLFGDAINVVNNRSGIFNRLALETGRVVDTLAGRLTAMFSGAGKGLQTFLSVGAANLKKLGEILVNLGDAFLHVLKVMNETHVDQILLSILVAASKLLDLITRLPTPLLAVAVGLHSIWLWGGLISTVFLQMLNPIRAVVLALAGLDATQVASGATAGSRLKAVLADIGTGTASLLGFRKASGEAGAAAKTASADMAEEAAAMSGAGSSAEKAAVSAGKTGLAGALSFLTDIPVAGWIALLVAGLTAVGLKLGFMHDQTMTWLTSLGKTLQAASIFQAVGTAAQQLAGVTMELAVAQKTGVGNVTELASGQRSLQQELGTSIDRVGTIARLYGTNFVGALALLNTAGVTTSQLFSSQNKVWAGAQAQVAGLVTGYRAMGQGLTQLQGDVSVQLVTGADQLKQMQALNKTWDTWLQLVQAGPTAVDAYLTSVQTLNTDLGKAGASLGGFNTQSLAARTQFDQLVPQMGTVQDAIRQYSAILQNGAAGSADLVRGTKDLIASSGLLGTTNKSVQASLLAVAQEADPSINTWQKLTRWMGSQGAAGSAQDLSNLMTQLQAPTANLSADAIKLTTALQQDLNPAMASAIFNAKGGQQAFNNFATAYQKFGADGGPTIKAARDVAQELLAIDGNSATARSQFTGFAEAMGMSKDQAEKLWKSLTTGKDAVTATSKSTEELRKSLGGAVASTAKLASPGLWGQIEHVFMAFWDTAKHLTIKGGIEIGHAFEAAWDGMVNWFTKSVPHAFETAWAGIVSWFTQSVPHAFDVAWRAIWSNVLNPVRNAFDDVMRWVEGNFDTWWKTHGSAVEKIWDTIWAAMRQTALNIWHFIETDVRDAWHVITSIGGSGAAKQIWDGFKGAAQATWAWIVDDAKASWTDITALAKAAWDIVAALAKAAWDIISNLVVGVIKSVWDLMAGTAKSVWDEVVALARIAWDLIVGIINVVIDVFTGHWHQAWVDLLALGHQVWNQIRTAFDQTLNAMGRAWGQVWNAIWSALRTAAVQTWNAMRSGAVNAFNAIWRALQSTVISPMGNFFTRTIPGWWNSFAGHAKSTWNTVWRDFNADIISPMGHWFSSTLPSAIEGAFRNSVNWVIRNVINRAIGFINDVTHVVGIPKIPGVPTLAAGGTPVSRLRGSVPGPADSDNMLARVMGGEYVLRQPARMALEAHFGRGFLDRLNHFDTLSGSGSRGILASQARHHAGGGAVGSYATGGVTGFNPLGAIEGFLGGIGSDLTSAAGSLVHLVSGGLSALKGLISKGSQAVFNGVWDATINPLLNLVPNGNVPGALVHYTGAEIKNGIDAILGAKDAAARKQAAAQTGTVHWSPIAGVTQWEGTALRALSLLGLPASDLVTVMEQIQTESGGNPNIVNKWDSNWLAGHPSVGLMQVIAGTFDRYAGPFRNTGPFEYGVSVNPLANIYSGLNYAVHTYGNPGWLGVLGHGHGYAGGGPVGMPGLASGGFAADAAAMWGDWDKFAAAWHTLHTQTRPAKASTAVWNAWNADLAIAANAANLIARHMLDFKNPANVTAADFGAIEGATGVQVLREVMQGHSPARQYWTSSVYPSAQAATTYFRPLLASAFDALDTYQKELAVAQAAWNGPVPAGGGTGTGTGGSPPDPGPPVPVLTPGAIPRPPSTTASLVNLRGYATMGGPSTGTAPVGTGTLGFAAGGTLGDTASMFALTLGGGGLRIPVALPAAQLGQLRRTQEMPRVMGAAAAATGNRVGLNVENITVHNPVPEPPSTSIAKSVNRLAFLAGRGV